MHVQSYTPINTRGPPMGGGYLFPCSPEINWSWSPVPQISKIWFSMFPVPKYCLCSPVPLKIWPLFPCSPEINALVPLFPKNPGRASTKGQGMQLAFLFCNQIFIRDKTYKKGFYSWLYKGLDSKNCKTVNNVYKSHAHHEKTIFCTCIYKD